MGLREPVAPGHVGRVLLMNSQQLVNLCGSSDAHVGSYELHDVDGLVSSLDAPVVDGFPLCVSWLALADRSQSGDFVASSDDVLVGHDDTYLDGVISLLVQVIAETALALDQSGEPCNLGLGHEMRRSWVKDDGHGLLCSVLRLTLSACTFFLGCLFLETWDRDAKVIRAIFRELTERVERMEREQGEKLDRVLRLVGEGRPERDRRTGRYTKIKRTDKREAA